ncbi:hypothetical protein LINPERPRIM_LOCUS35115 [Linum perenne]
MAEETGSSRPQRDYKVWTDEEVRVFIKTMVDLVELKHVENGNFRAGGYKEIERIMHKQVPGCTLKVDPHIKSKHQFFKDKFLAQLELKNVSEFGWDDSWNCVFVDDAIFAEYVKLEDAASVLQGDISMEDATDINGTPFPMADYDAIHSHEIMEELLNAGFDLHVNSLQPPPQPPQSATDDTTAGKGKQPATSSGQKRKRKNANDAYFASLQNRFDKFDENLGKTCMNIERIANTFCKDDCLTALRLNLFDELSSFQELSRQQVLQATRKLMNDDGEALTYFKMHTEAEKVEYVLFMLQARTREEEDEEEEREADEIELNLGLSLGGRFGVDKSSGSGSKLALYSSIAMFKESDLAFGSDNYQ